MRRIVSQIKTDSDEFRDNEAFHRARAAELDRRLDAVRRVAARGPVSCTPAAANFWSATGSSI